MFNRESWKCEAIALIRHEILSQHRKQLTDRRLAKVHKPNRLGAGLIDKGEKTKDVMTDGRNDMFDRKKFGGIRDDIF